MKIGTSCLNPGPRDIASLLTAAQEGALVACAWAWALSSHSLHRPRGRTAHFFCESPDGKCFYLYRPYSLSVNTVVAGKQPSSPKQVGVAVIQ